MNCITAAVKGYGVKWRCRSKQRRCALPQAAPVERPTPRVATRAVVAAGAASASKRHANCSCMVSLRIVRLYRFARPRGLNTVRGGGEFEVGSVTLSKCVHVRACDSENSIRCNRVIRFASRESRRQQLQPGTDFVFLSVLSNRIISPKYEIFSHSNNRGDRNQCWAWKERD